MVLSESLKFVYLRFAACNTQTYRIRSFRNMERRSRLMDKKSAGLFQHRDCPRVLYQKVLHENLKLHGAVSFAHVLASAPRCTTAARSFDLYRNGGATGDSDCAPGQCCSCHE